MKPFQEEEQRRPLSRTYSGDSVDSASCVRQSGIEHDIARSSDVSSGEFRLSSTFSASSSRALASSKERHLSGQQNVQEFTVNKLRFEELGLVGRDQQMTVLRECFERTTEKQNGNSELVLLQGPSGSGKSSLAFTLKEQIQKRRKGLLVSGKFDQNLQENEPYSTVIEALQEICNAILKVEEEDLSAFDKMRVELQEALVGMEQTMLSKLVPMLNLILAGGDPEQAMKATDSVSLSVAASFQNSKAATMNKDLLQHAIVKFIRLASTWFAPLVLVLDDLQWADIVTLELMQLLATDLHTPNLLLIGCYRSDEVDETHSLAQALRNIKNNLTGPPSGNTSCTITEILVDDLGVPEIQQILRTLLSMDHYHNHDDSSPSSEQHKKVNVLAEVCHRRTLGNVFFLLIFVKMLYQDGLLKFDLSTFAWRWEITEIETKTAATANVVELMKQKINRSSNEMITLLKLASCLGCRFEINMLQLVWEHLGEESSSPLDKIMQEAITEHFLERSPDGGYQWVHDKVQEAAMCLESHVHFAKRQLAVGKTLHQHLDQEGLEEAIFVVVNLLNNGSQESQETILESTASTELAQLNLVAARKAQAFSAFEGQKTYAQKAISCLPEDSWTTDKELSLGVYSISAEAAGCLGDLESMEYFSKVVIEQPNCTTLEKMRCYNAWISSIGRSGRMKEAMNLGLNVLNELGCNFPRNAFFQTTGAVSALLGFKNKLKRITPTFEQVSEMMPMSDPVQKEVMSVLQTVMTYAYLSKTPMVWILTTLRGFYLTMEYGVAEESPLLIGCVAIITMHSLGDWKTGAHFAEIALSMVDKLEEGYHEPQTLIVSHNMTLCWIKPMQLEMKFNMEGYKKAMQVGFVDIASHNIFNYEMASIMSGKSLHSIHEDCEIYVTQLEALNAEDDIVKSIRLFWQAALNLQDPQANTIELVGRAIENGETIENVGVQPFIQTMKSLLCAFFGEHEVGAKLALERGDQILKDQPGNPIGMVDPFHRGVSLYAMARSTEKSKGLLKKQAKKTLATLRAWVKNGNPNVVHQMKLLEAEDAALGKKNKETVVALYADAIKLSARGGFLQDAALSSERHGEYLLELKDVAGATFCFQQSIRQYSDWGAHHKANMLRDKYKDLLEKEVAPF